MKYAGPAFLSAVFFLVVTISSPAALAAPGSLLSVAQDSTADTDNPGRASRLKELRKELESYESQLTTLRSRPSTSQIQREIKLLEEEIDYTKEKIKDLESSAAPVITRTLRRGSSGEDVKQLQEFLAKDKEVYPESRVTGYFGSLTEGAVKKFQEKTGIEPVGIVGPQTREKIKEVALGDGVVAVGPAIVERKAREIPLPEVKSDISRNSTGEDVKKLQELLSKFPNAFPEKAVNGNFGPATERAVKKLQKSVGLAETGKVDKKTKEVINDLVVAIEKKKPPKIQDITPSSGAAGIFITINGRGFTDDDNAIFVKGRTVMKGLRAYDGGTTLEFVLPSDIPCSASKPSACPIKVVNANGISNARPFKLASVAPPQISPEPEPIPAPGPAASPTPIPPPPSPTPDPKLTITSLNPTQGVVGATVTITGTGFTATNNSVNFGGVNSAVTGLASSDGTTLTFTVPQGSCGVGDTCAVSVTNSRGTSNDLSFLLIQQVMPVKVVNPNGGEVFLQGRANTVKWSGGTDRAQILLVSASTTQDADPTDFIVGWITTSAVASSSITWDAKKVCNLEGDVCSNVEPGDYKILALSEDEVGMLTLWDVALERAGNWDVSDGTFRVYPESSITILKPNGGEYFAQGQKIVVCFDALSIAGKVVVVTLLKGGVPYLTINSGYQLDQASGNFVLDWTIPSDLPPASDYAIMVSDAAVPQVSDASDRTFTVAKAAASIRVYAPPYPSYAWWYGDKWVTNFKGRVEWYASNIASQAVNVNLLKGGEFYRALATNVAQQYYGSSQTYTSGWFSYDAPVSSDIPAGTDYAIEVVDSASSSVKGIGGLFEIVSLPSQMTFQGRLVDHFTKTPFSSERIYLWGASTSTLSTDANGAFSATISTANLMSRSYQTFYADPGCYEYKNFSIYANQYGPYLYLPVFEFAGPSRYQKIYGDAAFGDIPFWQKTPLTIASDVPMRHGLYYRDSDTGRAAIGLWSGGDYRSRVAYSDIVPVALDVWVKSEDPGMNVTYSPHLKLPVGACTNQVLTNFERTSRWEPYNIAVSLVAPSYTQPSSIYSSFNYSTKVSSTVSLYVSGSGGTAPYSWSLVSGALPPGITLDSSSGKIAGVSTVGGVYESLIRVTDTKGVNSVVTLRMTVYNIDGTLPPRIQVYYPYQNYSVSPGGSVYVYGLTFGIKSKAVAIDLMKGGKFYASMNASYQLYSENSYFSTSWVMPKDLPSGSDYTVRVYDQNNPLVGEESKPFWITSGVGAYWSANGAYANPYLTFRFATASLPYVKEFRLYQKRPGETAFSLAETFSVLFQCKTCQITSLSGKWYLWYQQRDYWTAWGPWLQSSQYPNGIYEYEVRTVSLDGIESVPIGRMRLNMLGKATVLSPTAPDSPIDTTTPMVRWTIPPDWPLALDRRFTMYIRNDRSSTSTLSMYGYLYTIVSPYDTVGFRKYEPQPTSYDPTKWEVPPLARGGKYFLDLWFTSSVYDPSLSSSVGYAALGSSTVNFWISP